MHMPEDDKVVPGKSLQCDISLDAVIYDGFLDVGFTRNFASSQAYADMFGNNTKLIPAKANQGLTFKKLTGKVGAAYRWLGFEAYEMIFNLLDEVKKDKNLLLDVLAYDLNEADVSFPIRQLMQGAGCEQHLRFLPRDGTHGNCPVFGNDLVDRVLHSVQLLLRNGLPGKING